MTHKEEIKYWANHPNGTKVWLKSSKDTEWKLSNGYVAWFESSIYIVDDEWAELRKAQIDGKQLEFKEYLIHTREEKIYERILGWVSMKTTSPNDWRIKPEEPRYEWQWVIQYQTGHYSLTTKHYTSKDEALEDKEHSLGICFKIVEPYEPSKRERK